MSFFKRFEDKPDEEVINTSDPDKRYNGKIVKISDEGYGFITSIEIPFTRIFFHWTSLSPDTVKFTELHKGMKVSFTASEIEDKGWRAFRVKVEE